MSQDNVTITITTDIDISAECKDCGHDLDSNLMSSKNGTYRIEVEPCPRCLENAIREAKEESERS